MTFQACLKSMRLRTLPLSLSGVLMGMFIAHRYTDLSVWTVVFLLLTTACLQILSNLSNELGDTLHGTDTADRQGMHYAVMDGEMTVPELKMLIAGMIAACSLSGLAMIYFSFGRLWGWMPLAFVSLGAGAIVAAMKYTLGRNPYGYRAKGDFYVFIFFGLVSTMGACFICSHNVPSVALLPASAVGMFSIGVLNVNNIRDMKTDARTRMTIAIKLGLHNARMYQTILISLGWVMMLTFTALSGSSPLSWIYLITLPLFGLHLKGVWSREDRALDPMLPLLVMSTFAMTLLCGVTL